MPLPLRSERHLLIEALLSPGEALTLRDTVEQPSPQQSPSGLPQQRPRQAGARTVTSETRTVFVTVTYPLRQTVPHLDPLPDREASSSTTFHSDGTVLAWTLGPSAWTPGTPRQFLEFGEAEAIQPGPSQAAPRAVLAPRA